jgi:hypothetical protein
MSDKSFPWGIIQSRTPLAGYDIIQYQDTFLGVQDGDILWHVDGVSFESEAEAIIYVGLLTAGVDVNTATRLPHGLVSGFGGSQ